MQIGDTFGHSFAITFRFIFIVQLDDLIWVLRRQFRCVSYRTEQLVVPGLDQCSLTYFTSQSMDRPNIGLVVVKNTCSYRSNFNYYLDYNQFILFVSFITPSFVPSCPPHCL